MFTGLYGHAFGEDAGGTWTTEIEAKIEKIRAEPDPMARYQLASELPGLAKHASTSDPDRIDDGTIADIAQLLHSNDDAVRYWAALALGQLGPRATVAVPELETALEEAELRDKLSIVGPELSTADGTREALRKITGRAYEPNR
ncbi:MAG: HEAT repeat domain-containing protein [Bradyrhizobium sp.]